MNDIFVDNCIMRLVQIAIAIRQNNDALTSQEFDRMEKEFDADEIDGQSFDACEEQGRWNYDC